MLFSTTMEVLQGALAKFFDCREEAITPDWVIGPEDAQLELDSMDMIELIGQIEHAFGIEISEEVSDAWYNGVTVQELHDAVVAIFERSRGRLQQLWGRRGSAHDPHPSLLLCLYRIDLDYFFNLVYSSPCVFHADWGRSSAG